MSASGGEEEPTTTDADALKQPEALEGSDEMPPFPGDTTKSGTGAEGTPTETAAATTTASGSAATPPPAAAASSSTKTDGKTDPPASPQGIQAAEHLAKIWKKDADDDQPRTFPQILMEILCNDEHSDIISWLPHGRSFIIYKKKKFSNSILPNFFKATKFTSFTRKLNRWGFTRVTRGPEMGSYYHKLFLRDDPQMCLRMSSHSSNKFQEPGSILPNPMVAPGVPFMPYGMVPGMLPPGMTQVDVSQQSQLINQQLQQLQWQQYQLQQYQQQQQQQQHNHATGPPPPPGTAPAPTADGNGPPAASPPTGAPPGPTPAWGPPPPMMPPGSTAPPPGGSPTILPPQQQQEAQSGASQQQDADGREGGDGSAASAPQAEQKQQGAPAAAADGDATI